MKQALASSLIAILTIPAMSAGAAEQQAGMGRLFMTPEARAGLERQRQLNIQESRNIEGESLRLDGVVMRSSGKSTIWVNQQSQDENTHDAGVGATLSRRSPERATLTTGSDAPVDLKVGVSVNRATRETAGGLAAGEIRVNRPAPK